MKNTKSTSNNSSGGLGILALAAIVVSSMIGGGIYSLPQNMAVGASAGAVLLGGMGTKSKPQASPPAQQIRSKS